jgi:hypothetical protein
MEVVSVCGVDEVHAEAAITGGKTWAFVLVSSWKNLMLAFGTCDPRDKHFCFRA